MHEHPWLSLPATIAASTRSNFLVGALIFGIIGLPGDLPAVKFIQQVAFRRLGRLVLVTLVLCLPKGRRNLKTYLQNIGLSKTRPIAPFLLLALCCSLILALSQATISLGYRLQEGYPVSWGLIRQVFDLSTLYPSNSSDLLLAFPSAFKDVAFRSVALTTFLRVYSERKSIIFPSLGFSMGHLLNLTSRRGLGWVLGQPPQARLS